MFGFIYETIKLGLHRASDAGASGVQAASAGLAPCYLLRALALAFRIGTSGLAFLKSLLIAGPLKPCYFFNIGFSVLCKDKKGMRQDPAVTEENCKK